VTVHIVLPNDIDDPRTPSGGNRYDRRVCDGLAALGWSVREHAVLGPWPHPGPEHRANLARVLGSLPENTVVLLDGLVASAAAEILLPQSRRLRLVVLVHTPLGHEDADPRTGEREALSAGAAVITTSHWSRGRLIDLYGLVADRVHVAPPGVDAAPLVPGSVGGSALLCVAAVMAHKGHDLLVQALARIPDLPWTCVCVGPLHREPRFVDQVRRQTHAYGIVDRIRLVGPHTGADLDARYATADLLVLPSRGETYGMVVTEALARGIPVLATAVNGLPEALGRAPDGSRPGVLVRPDDPVALADALRLWLGEPELRRRLRRSAIDRRTTLRGWASTSRLISNALAEVAVVQQGGVRG
jgi:glycosyltransferase involved in cell wall biosynthesis